jgi:ribosome-binding factor A
MDIHRIHRIESLVQTELAKLIQNEISNADLPWVTVTGIKISSDLSFAKVYVVSRDETDIQQTLKLLNQKAKSLRFRLAKVVRLRKIPELHFYYDLSISTGNRIDELLSAALKNSSDQTHA